MAKFRVRWQKKTIVVTLAKEDVARCFLNDLREEIKKQLNLNTFDLSLNGKERLPNDNSSLKDLGLISGDLVHVLLSKDDPGVVQPTEKEEKKPKPNPSLPSNKPHTETLETSCHQIEKEEMDTSTHETHTNTEESTDQPITHTNTEESTDQPIIDSETNKYLNEPMMIRESTIDSVPHVLNCLYKNTDVENTHDALFLVLHLLMVETGFQIKDGDRTHLPEGWKQAGGVKKLLYNSYCGNTQVNITLVYIVLGSMSKVYSTVENSSDHFHCQLKCADYIQQVSNDSVSTYKNLRKLSIIFKDKVSYPVLQSLNTDSVPNLSNLPSEVQIAIMKHLTDLELVKLSVVCKSLLDVCSDPVVWRRLYLKKFGKRINGNDVLLDWKGLYKEKYIEHQRKIQQQQDLMRNIRIHYPRPQVPHHGGPYPMPGVLPPGAIGGDFDRDPYFGGMPGAFGQGSSFLPPRPRFDPVGPLLPDQRLMRPGRGGGIWEGHSNVLNRHNPGGRRMGGGGGFGGGNFF